MRNDKQITHTKVDTAIVTADHDTSHMIRGASIIDFVSAGLAIFTGGASEAVMMPIRRVVQKRLKAADETLVTEMRNGLVLPDDVIDEDRLASFILRVQRAALEGTSRQKLKIMARYFFLNAPNPAFEEDSMADFAAVTEQLTSGDMKCLAVLKKARLNGFPHASESEEKRDGLRFRSELDVNGIFASEQAFNEAAIALLRFGFLDMASAWGGMAFFVTERCLKYVDNLDFETINAS